MDSGCCSIVQAGVGAGQGMGILVGSVTWYGKLVSWEIGQQGFGGSWQVKALRGARRAP